jgi:phosphate starvation-inducible PhoH-like protein
MFVDGGLFLWIMEEKSISLSGVDQLEFFGSHDENLHLIEEAFSSKIVVRGDTIALSGDSADVAILEKLFEELLFLVNRNGRLDPSDVKTVIDLMRVGSGEDAVGLVGNGEVILHGKRGIIRPKTSGQDQYVDAVKKNDIVFVIGPAGTGKTYLAVAMAVAMLGKKEISRIILTRPAIEAGESLGYLPGDLMDKVDPYLRPLTDALFSMLPSDKLQRHVDRKIVEIVPLAYMRGRTLNDAFVILDEAQNTTPMQMKMFLTRLGVSSKAIITGDVTQVDLPDTKTSGLIQIQHILKDIDGIIFVYMEKKDIVRHSLVKKIIQAYEIFHNKKN